MNSVELCARLREGLPSLYECSPAPREAVRVRTPLLYPDGDIVDVFVTDRDGSYTLTDFGESLAWLRMQSVSSRRSPKQRSMIVDVCQTLGVELDRGQLTLRSIGSEALGEEVTRLAQAAVRVSDIWFTLRVRRADSTVDEVTEWLDERQIPFDRNVNQTGRSGHNWKLDFRTRAERQTSLIFLLSTGSRGAARRITERVAAGCMDLSHLRLGQPRLAFVSLFDDTLDVWREEDFSLVEELSEVARWSRPDEVEALLRAA